MELAKAIVTPVGRDGAVVCIESAPTAAEAATLLIAAVSALADARPRRASAPRRSNETLTRESAAAHNPGG